MFFVYIIAGFVLPIPPPLCQKFVPKIIVSIVVGICQLYLDYVNCIWIVQLYLDSTIVFGLCQLYLDCVDYNWIVLIVD